MVSFHPVAPKLYFTSFLILYLELSLIRFLPAHVTYLGYVNNLILIASLLGTGLGFFLPDRMRKWSMLMPMLLLFLMVGVRLAGTHISAVETSATDVIFFRGDLDAQRLNISPVVSVSVIFVWVVAIFALLSQPLARYFRMMPTPLSAYAYDLLGALSGIAVFALGSYLEFPPVIWFGLFVCIYAAIHSGLGLLIVRGIVFAGIVLSAVEWGSGSIFWSPYSRLQVQYDNSTRIGHVFANNITHQFFSPLTEAPFYSLLYTRFFQSQAPSSVLIIGAGTGQDVAAALLHGAKNVDAVEIDPVIARIGKLYHPHKPYDDPRVKLIIQDGRRFMESIDNRYDLVIYALPDSLISRDGQGEMRLESFLYTREGMMAARNILAPGGTFVVYNDYRHAWLTDRVRDLVSDVFLQTPREAYLSTTSRMFVVKNEEQPPVAVRDVPTDDWPFFYIRGRTIPAVYVKLLVFIGIVSFVSLLVVLRWRGNPMFGRRAASLFLLGAAFALLETRSITQLALLFGSTWHVQAAAFAGILCMTYVAVQVRSRFIQIPQRILWMLLMGAICVTALVPVRQVLPWGNIAVSGAVLLVVLFLPVGIANILFADIYSDSERPDIEFGSNILGLVCGACLEYGAIIIGISALSWVALGLYGAAFMVLRLGVPGR